jgi:CRISPR-associated exonuclease Cas4
MEESMTYVEADFIQLSALQHYMVCPRQCALIHVEQIWEESRLTAEGRILHDRVDAGGVEKRGDVKRVFGLPIRSLRLGLSGKADVVEFHRQPNGRWVPYPVEHKRGRRKKEDWDRVQLCAQALCLEEMLGVSVPEGALFYGKEQRREIVEINDALRLETESVAAAVHRMLGEGSTPAPEYAKKCDSCSLLETCLPRGVGGRGNRVARYLAKALEEP